MVSGQVFSMARADIVSKLGVFAGVTTADGAVTNDTLICGDLIGANDYLTGKTVLILSPAPAPLFEHKPVRAFNPVNGQLTIDTTNGAFSAQVLAGTIFCILNYYPSGLDLVNILAAVSVTTGALSGLCYRGTVTAIPGANQFTIPTLAGMGAGKFSDVQAPYSAFVFRDAGGAGAIPQGQMRTITAYTTATGDFTTAAFGAAVGIGDEILILHPRLAEIATILADHSVPAADAAANTIIRDITGNKASTAIYTPDNVSDLVRYLKGLLNWTGMLTRPAQYLYEGWQDEAGIDATIWTITNPAGGTAWARAADGADLMVSSIPNANETARIRSNMRWPMMPTLYGTNKVLRRFNLDFEMQLADIANMDNALCVFGLTPGIGNDRTSNDIIVFCLTGDGLQTLTDRGGVETVNSGFAGVTLTSKNKFHIEIYLNHVKFYLNEVQLADHAANLPDQAMYVNFFVDTEAGGAATIKLGIIRAWPEDIAR